MRTTEARPPRRAALALLGLVALVATAATLTLASGPAAAHRYAPVLLNLTHEADGTLTAVWTYSRADLAAGDSLMVLEPGAACAPSATAITRGEGRSVVRRAAWTCAPAPGAALSVLVRGSGKRALVLQLRRANGSQYSGVLTGTEIRIDLDAGNGNAARGGTYFALGVEHILSGADHLAFVLCLFLLMHHSIRGLVGVVTAFTVGHSLSLAMAGLGLVALPRQPVEILIALSVAMLAADILRDRRRWTARQMWPLVCLFGLLHGLGFAGALMEIGLPEEGRVGTLLMFNVGVEAGQLLVIAGLVVLLWLGARLLRLVPEPAARAPLARLATATTASLVGATAGYWIVARFAALL